MALNAATGTDSSTHHQNRSRNCATWSACPPCDVDECCACIALLCHLPSCPPAAADMPRGVRQLCRGQTSRGRRGWRRIYSHKSKAPCQVYTCATFLGTPCSPPPTTRPASARPAPNRVQPAPPPVRPPP